jgi:uncharacterized protein YcbX
MRVTELWRYPVKSMQGERVDAAELTSWGLAGDRGWALVDLDTGFGLTARRCPELLHASARPRDDGEVEVTLPDGTVAPDDAALPAQHRGRRRRGELVGRSVGVGGAMVDVTDRVPRCVMVTRSQPDGIGIDRDVLSWIHRQRDGELAVGGPVVQEGAIRAGDHMAPV